MRWERPQGATTGNVEPHVDAAEVVKRELDGRCRDRLLRQAPASLVMRAAGVVLVGADLTEAVTLSWLLDDAARVETGLMQMGQSGDHTLLSANEAVARQVTAGRVYERIWEYLTFGDV